MSWLKRRRIRRTKEKLAHLRGEVRVLVDIVHGGTHRSWDRTDLIHKNGQVCQLEERLNSLLSR